MKVLMSKRHIVTCIMSNIINVTSQLNVNWDYLPEHDNIIAHFNDKNIMISNISPPHLRI